MIISDCISLPRPLFLAHFIIGYDVMPKFYKSGLRFECTSCGECCSLPDGRVEVTQNEATEIAAFLNLKFDDFVEKYCISGKNGLELKDNEQKGCIFLLNKRCTIYSARPLQCKTFPFWPENIKAAQRWEQVKTYCSGIDQGRLYSAEEIREIVRQQKERDRQRILSGFTDLLEE